MQNTEPLRLKKRGEDGMVSITLRLRESTLEELGKLAGEADMSRNELINKLIEYGITHTELI